MCTRDETRERRRDVRGWHDDRCLLSGGTRRGGKHARIRLFTFYASACVTRVMYSVCCTRFRHAGPSVEIDLVVCKTPFSCTFFFFLSFSVYAKLLSGWYKMVALRCEWFAVEDDKWRVGVHGFRVWSV